MSLLFEKIPVLDKGHLMLTEAWGRGETGEMEAAIIEAARQSTQGNFRGWDKWYCTTCEQIFEEKIVHYLIDEKDPDMVRIECKASWVNDEKLLGFLFNNKHSTPFEFCGLTIQVNAPIIVFREWHRHRTQSYNEMSARYAPLPDVNYVPSMERLFLDAGKNKQAQAISGSAELTELSAKNWLFNLEEFYKRVEDMYQYGLQLGIPKEVARLVLPVGRYSQMRATGNLRNWLQFLSLRMNPNAQWEIRQYANILGREIIANVFPRTWKLFEGTL